MNITSEALERAIEELARLPGTGRKSAQRIAMHLLKLPQESVTRLTSALEDLKRLVRTCGVCGTFSDQDPCAICANPKRSNGELCVVEEFQDMYFIERTNEFRGRYHVFGGVLFFMNNIGPDQIRIRQLVQRVAGGEEPLTEVILALNPDAEGEATSFYIQKLLQPFEIKVTRIAYGIPVGSELEYIDDATLSRAFRSRSAF
jgi:recombination protein RecR